MDLILDYFGYSVTCIVFDLYFNYDVDFFFLVALLFSTFIVYVNYNKDFLVLVYSFFLVF